MLKHRVITAAILIPIVVAAIYIPDNRWFTLLSTLIVAIGAWEWATLCRQTEKARYLYSLITVLLLGGLYWQHSYILFSVLITIGAVYWFFAVFLVIFYQKQRSLLPKTPSVLLLVGLLLLVPMWSSLILLKSFFINGASLLMFLFLLVWSADTAAYFAGKKWGRRKLADRVSPGKTWEGTLAGIVAGIIMSLCYVIVSNGELEHKWIFIGLSIMTVVMSVFGDLMESLVKREVNIKDSGSILPGHGGIMDRLDSLTAASTVFALGMLYIGATV